MNKMQKDYEENVVTDPEEMNKVSHLDFMSTSKYEYIYRRLRNQWNVHFYI